MKKRNALTLIELILSMVIIAIAFSVLPKMILMSQKISKQSIKEEAIYSAVALMGLIKSTAWDENNTNYDDILITSGDSAYNCSDSTNFIRVGGFRGSRNCDNNITSSTLGSDSGEPPYDDMDDFSAITSQNDYREYNLSVTTAYVSDPSASDTNITFSDTPLSNSTNLKYIDITIIPKTKAGVLGNNIGHFYIYASNIGQTQINKRAWDAN